MSELEYTIRFKEAGADNWYETQCNREMAEKAVLQCAEGLGCANYSVPEDRWYGFPPNGYCVFVRPAGEPFEESPRQALDRPPRTLAGHAEQASSDEK